MGEYRINVQDVCNAGNSVASSGDRLWGEASACPGISGISEYADITAAAQAFTDSWKAPMTTCASSLQHLGHTARDIAIAVDADDVRRSHYFRDGHIKK